MLELIQKSGVMSRIRNNRNEITMNDKQTLIENLDKLHTTEMGIDRIRKNLRLETGNVVDYCKSKILDENCTIYKQGKNWYCEIDKIKITINSHSYTIITAHIIK